MRTDHLCAQHCAKCFMYIILCNFHDDCTCVSEKTKALGNYVIYVEVIQMVIK